MALAELAGRRPLVTLALLALTCRLLTSALLLALHSLLPSFDASAQPLLASDPRAAWLEPFLRWDTLYFASIATRGYRFEQELAFSPGLPGAMHVAGRALGWLEGRGWAAEVGVREAVMGGVVVSWAAGVGAVLALYKTTLALTSNPRFAFLSSLLFLLPPSPPTLASVPYTEPFAALFSFLGMWAFLRRRHLPAALAWGAGSGFRPQCLVLGVGFFGWRFVLEEPVGRGRGRYLVRVLLHGLPKFAALSAVSVAPFAAFQWWAHGQFCISAGSGLRRPWCDQGVGASYGWVQREYWDVGLFRYWTPNNIPNFLFAAPVLALSFAASYAFYSHNPRAVLTATLPFLPPSLLPRPRPASSPSPSTRRKTPAPPPPSPAPFLSPSLTPFVHLHSALTLLLVFASHTQIALRLCAADPVVWWYAAHLCSAREGTGERRWGRRWVRYCVVWGSVACALWAGFLPPA